MKLRERLSGIWLMTTTLLSLFAYTIYFVAQMWLNILHTAYLTLAVLQCATLIIYLWGPEKLTARPLKLLYRFLYASSVCVIPAFLFIFISGNLLSGLLPGIRSPQTAIFSIPRHHPH